MRIEYYSGATAGRGRYGLVTGDDSSGFSAREIAEAQVPVFIQVGNDLIETGIQTVYRSGKPRFLTNGENDIHLQLTNYFNFPTPTRSLLNDQSTMHPEELVAGNYVLKSIELTVQLFTNSRVEFSFVSFSTCSNNYSNQIGSDSRRIAMRENEIRIWTMNDLYPNPDQGHESEPVLEPGLMGPQPPLEPQNNPFTPTPLPEASTIPVQMLLPDEWLVNVNQSSNQSSPSASIPQKMSSRQVQAGYVYLRAIFTVTTLQCLDSIYPAFKHGRFLDAPNSEISRRANGYTDQSPVDSNGNLMFS